MMSTYVYKYSKKKRKDQAKGSILTSLRLKSLESTSDSTDKWNLTFKLRSKLQFKDTNKSSKKTTNRSISKVISI